MIISLITDSKYLLDRLSMLEPIINFSLKKDEETGIPILVRKNFVESKKKIPILFYEFKYHKNSKRFVLKLKKPINEFYIKQQILITKLRITQSEIGYSGSENNLITAFENEIGLEQFKKYFGIEPIEIINRYSGNIF